MPSTAAGKPDAKGYRLMIPNASRHTDKTLPCSSAHTGTFIVPPASAASPSEGTPALLVRGPPQLVLKCNPPPWRKRTTTAQSAAHQRQPPLALAERFFPGGGGGRAPLLS